MGDQKIRLDTDDPRINTFREGRQAAAREIRSVILERLAPDDPPAREYALWECVRAAERVGGLDPAAARPAVELPAALRDRIADRLLAKDAESWGYGTFECSREFVLALADEMLAVRDVALAAAVQRLELAQAALLDDGYFTEDQVSDDVAPRITERLAALRREVAYVAETGEKWRRLWEQVNAYRSEALVRAEQAEAALLELAPLRDSHDVEDRLRRERNEWRAQCELAEAAVARVRRLCDLTIAASCRVQAIAQAEDTLRVLDVPADGEQPGEVFEPSPSEWDIAVASALAQLGCTLPELEAMADAGDFASERHRQVWLTIKPADGEQTGGGR